MGRVGGGGFVACGWPIEENLLENYVVQQLYLIYHGTHLLISQLTPQPHSFHPTPPNTRSFAIIVFLLLVELGYMIVQACMQESKWILFKW